MIGDKSDILEGLLLEENTELTLVDLSKACSVSAEWIILLVEEGVLDPVAGSDAINWRFSGVCLRRVQTAQRLQRDLGLNIAGTALALELIDEIESLRRQLIASRKD